MKEYATAQEALDDLVTMLDTHAWFPCPKAGVLKNRYDLFRREIGHLLSGPPEGFTETLDETPLWQEGEDTGEDDV